MKNVSIFFTMRRFMSKAIFCTACKNCFVSKICRLQALEKNSYKIPFVLVCLNISIYSIICLLCVCLFMCISVSILFDLVVCMFRRLRLLSPSSSSSSSLSFIFPVASPVGRNCAKKIPCIDIFNNSFYYNSSVPSDSLSYLSPNKWRSREFSGFSQWHTTKLYTPKSL